MTATSNNLQEVSEIINQRPLSRFQLRTILLCGLVLVLDGFDTQSIGFLAPSIAQSLHLSIRTFGPIFSAALIGLMVSSLVVGPLADRVGRKLPIIAATLTFAVFAIATARATTFHELVTFRFLTGLGLGGAIPNAVALTAEYSPKRLQRVFVTVLFCSMPMGALLGGLVSAVILPRWGWQSVFYAGGTWWMLPYTPDDDTALRYVKKVDPNYVVLDSDYAAERPYVMKWLASGIPDRRARVVFSLKPPGGPDIALIRWSTSP